MGPGSTRTVLSTSNNNDHPHLHRSIFSGTRRSSTSVMTETTEKTFGPTQTLITPIQIKKGGNQGDKGHTRSTSRTSLRLHQPLPDPTLNHPKKKHTRTRLSPTERVYEDPDIAKEAFQAERAENPFHRRAPTPYTSRSRRGSQSSVGGSDSDTTQRTVERRASARSLRSRVSFESRSLRINETGRTGGEDSNSGGSGGDDEDEAYRPRSRLGAWDPGFGASQGIGPAGEAIEVIGLGRKQPRHRIFRREMLKPALRSAMSSRVTVPGLDLGGGGGRVAGGGGGGSGAIGRRDKPLPTRPGSIVSSVIDVLRSRPSLPPANTLRAQRNRGAERVPPSSFRTPGGGGDPVVTSSTTRYQDISGHTRNTSQTEFPLVRTRSFHPSPDDWAVDETPSPTHQTPQNARPSLRSFLSSFSRNLSIEDPPLLRRVPTKLRSRPRSPILLISPADNLFNYLSRVYFTEWRDWPSTGGESERRWDRKKGSGLGWEWFRRLEVAEGSRGMRALSSWEAGDRYWGNRIVDWCHQNVPVEKIELSNRWGKQIFALPAQGYETLEFHDEKSQGAGDNGLLSWVTGSLLQTAISTLHMLRHSSTPFSFHLIPSPAPPYLPPRTPTSSSGRRSRSKDGHALWEGFGTLVSVHKEDPSDRSLIIEIRPPSVVTGGVMREFARSRREWWMLPSEVYTGDAGQANLLQSQVYDACVQNQVFFFVVTNLKYWIFGVFNPTYTSATVSPVIERKGRDPSVMQCVTTWLVRSVDERPKATEPVPYQTNHSAPPTPQSPVAPPYTQNHPQGHSRSRSHRAPTPEYNYPSPIPSAWPPNFQTQQNSYPQSYGYNPYPSPALSDFGYQSGGIGMGMHSYGGVGQPGYGTWSPAAGGYDGSVGSHSRSPVPQGQVQGNYWYGSTGWGR